jgi:hypothetical protein
MFAVSLFDALVTAQTQQINANQPVLFDEFSQLIDLGIRVVLSIMNVTS